MGRARVLLVVAGWIAVTVWFSCAPEPVRPTDYSTLTVDSVAFYCVNWHPAPPSQARGLFDVLFLGHDRGTRPTAEDRERILAAGGEIVYEFHEPIIRAVLDATAIPGFRSNAWGVTDADAYLLTFNVNVRSEITEEDREYVSALGGTILREGKLITSYYMKLVLPDASVPDLYAWDRLSYVGLSYISACPAKPRSPWELPAGGRGIVR